MSRNSVENEVRIYADPEEQERMRVCHERSISVLRAFLASMPELKYFRALDVGAGDGRVTKYLLRHRYHRVDLFDPCPVAKGRATRELNGYKGIDRIERSSMQDYKWSFYYSGIFLVWCACYVNDEVLTGFLKRAAGRLIRRDDRASRNKSPHSCIFVMDNVLEEGQIAVPVKEQTLRTKSHFERIFNAAGLVIFKVLDN